MIVVLGAWNIVLNQQLSSAQAQQAATEQVLAIAQQPGGQAAILTPGTSGGPTGLAAVAHRRLVRPGGPRPRPNERQPGL